MISVINGQLNMFNFLLDKNVDCTIRDNFKWTVMHHAVRLGNLDIVKRLYESDSRLKSSKSVSGLTPKMLADKFGLKDISFLFCKPMKLSM